MSRRCSVWQQAHKGNSGEEHKNLCSSKEVQSVGSILVQNSAKRGGKEGIHAKSDVRALKDYKRVQSGPVTAANEPSEWAGAPR